MTSNGTDKVQLGVANYNAITILDWWHHFDETAKLTMRKENSLIS